MGIKEKGKEVFEKIKKEWESLTTAEKLILIGLAIATTPIIAIGVIELGKKKLREMGI